MRRIHKATVRDRLVHHALFRVLYPLFDRTFIHDSYSCRVGKGTHRAVQRLEVFSRKISLNGRRNFWTLKCDVRRFFDSVDHHTLSSLIRRQVHDGGALWLVERILASFHTAPGSGLPLGNVTSQLFANIYLNELDRFVKHDLGCRYYLRYCDDFLILSRNFSELGLCRDWIAGFLSSSLGLALHSDKVRIRKYSQGIDFLGYVVRPHHTVLRTRTKRRMLARISAHNALSYFGMLKHCDSHKLECILEAALRQRSRRMLAQSA
ncbi:MAG: group II intron reverse transcriptase domain-containing protein [Candidatus Yanofskybacteria bacterium]|nr:group II intron reverse transcriptase domain-containing protein [Candidatus Yanofskybacteria bacterium]